MQQSSTSNSAAAGADQSRSLMSNADLGTIQDSVPDTEVESVSTTRSTAGTDSQAADESSASDDSSEDCSGSSSLNLENLQWSPSPHAQTVSASEDALPRSAQGTGAGTGTGTDTDTDACVHRLEATLGFMSSPSVRGAGDTPSRCLLPPSNEVGLC